LIVDRLPDFHRLAEQKGIVLPKGNNNTTAAGVKPNVIGAPGGKSQFMKDFFDRARDVSAELSRGRSNVKLMEQMLEEVLGVTMQAKEKAISDKLADLVQDTNRVVASVKKMLEEMQAQSEELENKQAGGAELQIRRNMQQSLVRKHQALLMDFQRAQGNFKEALEKRQAREIQILMPEVRPDQVEQMLEAGETASMMVAKKMLGTHAELLDELARIREKHQDILRLERSMAELAQMFQEMAVLVEHQGEMIDAIEFNIREAKDYTAKAEQQLITTKKVQRSNRKWMCYAVLCMLVVLLVILGPVMIATAF